MDFSYFAIKDETIAARLRDLYLWFFINFYKVFNDQTWEDDRSSYIELYLQMMMT